MVKPFSSIFPYHPGSWFQQAWIGTTWKCVHIFSGQFYFEKRSPQIGLDKRVWGGGVTFSWTKNEISYVETLRENESPFIIFHHFLTYNTLYMEVLWNAYYIKQNVSTKLWLFSTFYRRNKILSDSSVILFLIRQLGVMEFWYAVKGIKIFLVLALITIKMLLGIKYHTEHGFK